MKVPKRRGQLKLTVIYSLRSPTRVSVKFEEEGEHTKLLSAPLTINTSVEAPAVIVKTAESQEETSLQ